MFGDETVVDDVCSKKPILEVSKVFDPVLTGSGQAGGNGMDVKLAGRPARRNPRFLRVSGVDSELSERSSGHFGQRQQRRWP